MRETFTIALNNRFADLINVSGTMTALGGSVCAEDVRVATSAMMARFVNMHELQAEASRVIAELTGAEAGCLTASASAAMTLSIAGAMTGLDPAAVENLPQRPGEKCEVAVQMGHLCGYGAPVSQAVELTGATVRIVGQSTLCADHQLEGVLSDRTAAALFVASHHVVHYGQIPLKRFAEICHAKQVPVIVDAASEYDLRWFLDQGADIVIYSGHKFLGGPTSGVIAGRRDLVRATYFQNIGIGRGMKIGKESIAGTIAALEAWAVRDHDEIRKTETAALTLWQSALAGVDGVTARIMPDPTNNPLDRLQVEIDPLKTGWSAAQAAAELGAQSPKIIVRNHKVEQDSFQLDPCNILPGQAEKVATALKNVLTRKTLPTAVSDARNGGVNSYLAWLA